MAGGGAGQGRSLIAGLAAGAVTLAVISVLGAVLAALVYFGPGPVARRGDSTTVVLKRGSGVYVMGAALAQAGVIRAPQLFVAAAELTGAARRLRAGEYDIPSRASLAEILRKIRSGDIVHHRITIPEGLSSKQVMAILNASDVLTGDAPTPPEGAVLPETYEVTRGETRSAVLQRMMDARDRTLAALWTHRKPGLPFTDPEQAVTLASIVEKETRLAAERPRVAAVYLNRLRIGMKLDADPTVIYGVTGGLPLGRGLTRAELQSPNPYNTYVQAGLPPGPIDNPGRASLAAVLDPPDTQDLYFVADGTGGHVFARTLEEQSANVARWRKIERAARR